MLSLFYGVSQTFNTLQRTLTDSVPSRFLLCRPRHRTICRLREHHAGSFEAGNAARNVLECFEYCVAHRSAHSRCVVEEEGWTDGLHWSASMEWCVFDDRYDVAHRIVHCYFQDAEKRVEDMSVCSGYMLYLNTCIMFRSNRSFNSQWL